MEENTSFELPEDIVRLIIEAFTFQAEKNDILRLLTISRDVKAWIEPGIYSRIVLKSRKQVLSFAAALRGEYTFCCAARHVRTLWLLCIDLSATQHLNDIPKRCPNLVHFAFDGQMAPFSSSQKEGSGSVRLTRLSICSPSLLDVAIYKEHPPIQWEHLTHLHILGPGDINDSVLYDHLLSLQFDRLVSLEHLCIELTYPSPETELFKYTFFSEAALFYLYLKEGLLREMLDRLPRLRKVIIKTNFSYPRFRILWDDLKKLMEDIPQVSFEMKPLPNQDFYESTLPCSALSGAVWQTLMQNSLLEIERSWTCDS
ncbi:hypothetical protein ACEPAH_6934 [Sanghuangporus vaninii]